MISLVINKFSFFSAYISKGYICSCNGKIKIYVGGQSYKNLDNPITPYCGKLFKKLIFIGA